MQCARRAAIAILVCALPIAGCIGIGHVKVLVPDIVIAIRTLGGSTGVDIACAEYYAQSETFLALVSGALSNADYHYDWKRLNVASAPVQTQCRGEDRYIGFPAIAFVPSGPSDEAARSRALFIRIEGDALLYRIRFHGNSAEIDETAIDAAARRAPAQLGLPEPAVGTAQWSERIRTRGDYYRETKWNPSNRISVTNLRTDERGAILTVSIELRHDG